MTFDNSGGGSWSKYINIPITTTPSEEAQYKVVIGSNNVTVYSAEGTQKTQGNSGITSDFWNNVKSDGSDIRVFNQNKEQRYFWIEEFDYNNKKAIMWVKVEAGDTELNIAYGNPSATKSNYENPHEVFLVYGFDDLSKWSVAGGTLNVSKVTRGFTVKLVKLTVETHQGVAVSPDHYYTFHTNRIDKYDRDWNLISQNTDPFNGLSDVNHVGDGDYYDGKLYVPVCHWDASTETSSNKHIVVYDADTLSMIEAHPIDEPPNPSSITIDPDDGWILISSYESGGSDKVYKYSLSDFSYLGYIQLPQAIVYTNGIAYKDGYIYLTDEAGNIWKAPIDGSTIELWGYFPYSGIAQEGIDWDGEYLLWLNDLWEYGRYIAYLKEIEMLKADRGTTDGENVFYYYSARELPTDKFVVEVKTYNEDQDNNEASAVGFYIDPSEPHGYVSHVQSYTNYKLFVSGVKNQKVWGDTGYSDINAVDLPDTEYLKCQLITIKVKVDGSNFTTYVYDGWGNLLGSIEWSDTSYISGYVGIRQWRSVGYYKDFKVYKLADPADFGTPQVKTFEETGVFVTNEDAYHGNYSCKFVVIANSSEGEKYVGIKQSQDLTGFNKVKFALKITELTGHCAFEVWTGNSKLTEYTSTTSDWEEKEVDVSSISGTQEVKFIARAKDYAEDRKIVAYLDKVVKST